MVDVVGKRFFVRVYSNNEPFFFDEKQEYVEERYTCEDVRNLHPMGYWQVVDLLNEQQATIERLQEKVTDYEIILSITKDKRTLCKEQQIDDVAFYCERYSDYRCYPLCPNTKDCFKADGTFQEKLKDLKEFWGEKWK